MAYRATRMPWTTIEIAAIRILLISSVSAFVFAVLPFPMLLARWDEASIWRAASGVLGVFLSILVGLGFYLVYGRSLRPRRPLVFWTLELSGAIAAAIVLSSAAEFPATRGPWAYCVGLLWLLVTSTVQFMQQIFSSWKSDAATAE